MTKSKNSPPVAPALPDAVAKRTDTGQAVTPEQRYHYVEVAAYYIAERRGFDAGSADDDWARAELEIDRLLAEGVINR